MQPVELSEVDRLRLQLALSQRETAQARLQSAMAEVNRLMGDLSREYDLTPTDSIDANTGAIKRTRSLVADDAQDNGQSFPAVPPS